MSAATHDRAFAEVDLDLIDEPILPSRTQMDDDQLEALAESIRTVGLQQPMIVARVGERYEVIAGHRRRIACGRAGLTKAPCIVYPSKDIPRHIIQAHENTKREALNPADEALWFVELLEQECGGDIEKLCGLVGEKFDYVSNRIALFRGDQTVFEALRAGKIRIGVAHELNKCPDEHYRRYYLDCAIRSGATVSVVVGWITEWRQSFQAQPQAPASAAPELAAMPIDTAQPFTCYVCGRADHVHLIRPLYVHQHCQLAILDPLLNRDNGNT